MIEKDFQDLYENFRMRFYKKLFQQENEEEENKLTNSEMQCAETIYLLKNPNYTQLADFWNVSKSNANYKINLLIKKKFIKKIPSLEDKREFHLEVSDKFIDYYLVRDSFTKEFSERMKKEFNKEELVILEKFLKRITKVMKD